MAKENDGQRYIVSATNAIKAQGPIKELYRAIYKVEGSKTEVQRLTNRLNPERSNPGADFLGLVIAHLPELHEMSVAEFFGLDQVE
ncbi:hypothetical protein [Photobacterium sp. R1]